MRSICLASAIATVCTATAAEVATVSSEESVGWCDHLIPLPHEIEITRQVAVPPQDVSFAVRADAGDVEQQALAELMALFKEKAGVEPRGQGFTIRLDLIDGQGRLGGVAHPGAGKLSVRPNNEQAYLIEPRGDTGLLVAALHPKGLYHGVQTLKQLLASGLTPERAVVPLARVLDWPDVDERGLWNFDLNLIPWIASLKLNFAKASSGVKQLERGKPAQTWVATTDQFPDVLAAGHKRALKVVPIVMHLNYIGAKHGGYDAYPGLAGQGDEAVPTIWYEPRRIRVPCGANPALKQIIAECLMDFAAKGALDVSVWLSEFWGQCQCATCLEAGQLRMETQAAYQGWIEARKQFPALQIRIFYCMGGKTEEDTYAVLAELPAEVKIERCYGRFGEAFDRIATAGRWLASYAGPPLPKAEYSGLRFHGGSNTREYVRRLLEREWDAVYSINYVYSKGGYQRGFFDFHVNALAEWTWNLNGRDLGQLARAWAVRRGYAQPEKVSAWVVLMDPVEKTLHYVLTTRNWGKLPDAVKSSEQLQPGQALLAGFPSTAALAEQIAVCQRARAVASDAEAPELVFESDYAIAFTRALQALNTLLAAAAPGQSRDAALADLRRLARDMTTAFDAKTDLVKAEPAAFAEATKTLHAELWRTRVEDIAAALPGRD